MKKTFVAFVAVAAIAASFATPASAQRGLGAAVAGGIIGGAIVGSVIAANPPPPPPYAYYPVPVRPMWKLLLPRAAASFASASGMVTNGASAASRSAIDLTGTALNSPRFDSQTRPVLLPGFSFSTRRAHRTQHRFARPAIHLEASRFLGAKRRARLHPGLAIQLVTIEAEVCKLALHGFDVGSA